MTTSNSKYLILACDGGGIRGLIPAMLLQSLATNYPKFLDSVYLYAGTSTGGIISLALASNVSATEMVDLYENNGSGIFQSSSCMSSTAASKPQTVAPPAGSSASSGSWWEWILEHLEDLTCTWYTNSGLYSLLESKLGSNASSKLSSIVSSTNPQYVLVNTFQLCAANNVWTPLQLTNLPNVPGNTSGSTLVIDAAMSTSAAPMYFPPYSHPTYGYCVDGGMFANNPGTIALTTLVNSGIALENIWMLSLSTGNSLNSLPASIVNDFGVNECGPLFWFWPLAVQGSNNYTPSLPMMSVIFDGTSDVDTYQCQQLLGAQYQRANVPLSMPIALNDYSPAAITAMQDSTNNYLEKSEEWGNIVAWITENFS